MQRLALTVRTAIERALDRFDLPSSESVVRLLLMIAAHESGGFTYCKQRGGPALGMYQMEPTTHGAVIEYLERTGKFPGINRSMRPERMLTDLEYATAMARVYLWMRPEPLPDAENFDALAAYAKQYWNTHAGKATTQKYKEDFLTHVWGNRYAVA